MKQNIEITIEEVKAVKTLIENKFNSISQSPIKINSNPSNYELLQEKIVEAAKVKVGNRFLCKFLYESNNAVEPTMSFRRDRVEALYVYISGDSRQNYLSSYSIHPHKVLYVPTPGFQKIEIDEFIQLAGEKNIILVESDFFNIENIESIQFWNLVNSESIRLLVCINEGIIKDVQGMLRLSDLLLKYISRLVVESNITFLFSKELFTGEILNINKYSGHIEFTKFWQDQLEILKENLVKEDIPSSIKTILDKEKSKCEIILKNSLQVIRALAEIYKLNWNSKKIEFTKAVDIIQPITARISGCEVRKLTDVISDLGNSVKSRDLLCVISYDKYYEHSELVEMNRYFKDFYDKLSENHNIIRVFCLKGKRNNRGVYSSLHSMEENKNALDYLELTPKQSKSFVLIYDESPWFVSDTAILYEQDYILSIPKQDIDYNSVKDIEQVINGISEDDEKDTKLYLTYPEDDRGINRMIELTELNFVAIKKWITDFIYRINSNIHTENHIHLEYSENKNEIKKMLK